MKHHILNQGTIDAFRAAYKDSERIFSMFSKFCGLSDSEYWALLMIREGAKTQSEICEQLSLSKQTVNSAFRQLVKKGLVRLEAVENNLRTKRIFLTESGVQFVEKHIDSMLLTEEHAWYAMTEEERITLTMLTQKYNALMEAELIQCKKLK